MALTQFTDDIAFISKLPDSVKGDSSLTKPVLKARFDAGGLAIQTYINEVLIPMLDAGLSANSTAESGRVSAELLRDGAESARAYAEQFRVLAENFRNTNEGDSSIGRIKAENDRVTAESLRVIADGNRTTAETNRASAESSRVTAESDRVTAESSRVSAEELRVTADAGRQAGIDANTTSISELKAQELQSTCVVHPRLPNGVINTFENGSFIERAKKYVLQASNVTSINTSSFTNVDTIDLSYANMSGVLIPASLDAVGTSVYTTISVPRNGDALDVATSAFRHYKNTSYWTISVPKGTYANLAAAQAALTGTIVYYQLATNNTVALPTTKTPNTQELVRLSELVDKKANIAQEAWITPTLLNSWAHSKTLQYKKSSVGVVHIRGEVSGGTSGSVIFTLPVTYRPIQNTTLTINGGGLLALVGINAGTGAVTIVGSSLTYVVINVSFLAEQ